MKALLAAIVGVAVSSCGNGADETQFQEFRVSRVEADGSIAVTPNGAGTVYVNQYAQGPNGPRIGTAILVIQPGIQPHTLEALDVDGDGYWDTVRYMAKIDGARVWVEDNDGDGVVDSTTPVIDSTDSLGPIN